MPLYFFDIVDGGVTTDYEGTEFPSLREGQDAALKTLLEVSRDEMSKGQSYEAQILMRDEAGRELYTASLVLTAKRMVEAS